MTTFIAFDADEMAEALGAAYQYRGTRSVGPPALVCGTPSAATGPDPDPDHTECTDDDKERPMLTVTVSANDPDALRAALDALTRDGRVSVTTDEHEDPDGVVTPIHRNRRPA